MRAEGEGHWEWHWQAGTRYLHVIRHTSRPTGTGLGEPLVTLQTAPPEITPPSPQDWV